MIKNKFILTIVAILLIGFASCKKETLLNSKADVLEIILGETKLECSPEINSNEIICNINTEEDVSLRSLTPYFRLTKGATIFPKSGTTLNFKTPQVYTVCSEDKQISKKYKVIINRLPILKKCLFDDYTTIKVKIDGLIVPREIHEISEKEGGLNFTWATNSIAIGKYYELWNNKPEKYPVHITEDAYKNTAVEIVTCGTNFIGENEGVPLVAGTIFMGNYVFDKENPLESVQFGLVFNYEPLKFRGYYKYKSGDEYREHTDENGVYNKEGKIIEGKKDECAMYAVFYETDENTKYLDETNILTHKNIISVAKVEQAQETSEWVLFEAPFETKDGKTVDLEKLQSGKYNLAVILSSSKNGAKYNAAVGSELIVDELELELDN